MLVHILCFYWQAKYVSLDSTARDNTEQPSEDKLVTSMSLVICLSILHLLYAVVQKLL